VPAPSDEEDFTVKISRKKQKTISKGGFKCHPACDSPPQTTDKSHCPAASYLSAPREKIPPVIIHHFGDDVTKINKEFHAKF
jgi:hypothetical protein